MVPAISEKNNCINLNVLIAESKYRIQYLAYTSSSVKITQKTEWQKKVTSTENTINMLSITTIITNNKMSIFKSWKISRSVSENNIVLTHQLSLHTVNN